MIGANDITTIFGMKGSGKSDLGRAISRLYPRLVVIDVLREWKKKESDLITDDFFEAADFLEKNIGNPKFRLVFQFSVDLSRKELEGVFNEFLRLLYKRGEITGENVCLLIEEVHFFCGPNWIFDWLFKLNTVSRHANMAMIMSSQRPASVHKSCVSQAANVFVGQLFEKRDIEYLRDTIGDTAEGVSKLKKFDFIFHRLGKSPVIVDKYKFSVGKL